MPVRFTGLLSRTPVEALNLAALEPRHAARPLDAPEVGLVLRMPEWQPAREMLEPYLERIGLLGADWLFLAYEEWSGPVDYVQRYGQIGETRVESVSAYDFKARRLYAELMEMFGLGAQAEGFAPLQKGYWNGADRV